MSFSIILFQLMSVHNVIHVRVVGSLWAFLISSGMITLAQLDNLSEALLLRYLSVSFTLSLVSFSPTKEKERAKLIIRSYYASYTRKRVELVKDSNLPSLHT